MPPTLTVQEPGSHGDCGVTLLDQADAWIESVCAAAPRLRESLSDIEALAQEQVRVWDLRHDAALKLLQRSDPDGAGEGQRGFGGRHLHFFLTRMVRAMRYGHEALSVLIGANDDPLPRQHRAIVIITMTLAVLCVDVWMCVDREDFLWFMSKHSPGR